jgi:hypothetical protein
MPATPATEPFALTDFSGDGVPEVTIASWVEKYSQFYYLLRFDAKKRGLVLLEYAMGKPERAGQFVRLYSNAGRRPIWEEWRYLRWDGDRLFEKASWHDEYPDRNIDLHFVRATARDDSGRAATFVITDAESDSKQESAYVIKKGKKAFAKIVFAWGKSRADDYDEIERAYLFEKILGMSRALYPAREDTVKLDRFEEHGTVRIDGSKDAVRRLSIKR